MPSPHLFHLSAQTPHNKTEAGYRIKANTANFPILKGLSLYKLMLHPKGIREPHWHPNADEMGYCLQGEVIVSFYHTGDFKQSFLVQEGEVFLVPSGALHSIENVGKGDAELILAFSHEFPEDFSLSNSVGMLTNAVLGNTWGVGQEHFQKMHRPLKDPFAVLRHTAGSIPPEARYANPYRFSLEASQPLLEKSGGSARMARQNVWPVAKNMALYSLKVNDRGMREPHWHPETAEMGYVHKGKGRMTILNPDGKTDTYLLHPGDLYFIPKAYPHHIENVGQGDIHFLIFFDQPMPRDIGFTGSIKSFSNEVLSVSLGVEPAFLDRLNKYYTDLFIVDRINPVDPP